MLTAPTRELPTYGGWAIWMTLAESDSPHWAIQIQHENPVRHGVKGQLMWTATICGSALPPVTA